VVLEHIVVAVGNEPDAIDVPNTTLGLAQEVEDEPFIDLLVVLDGLIDLEDEPTPVLIAGILPGGIDALPEIIDGIDVVVLVIDTESTIMNSILRPMVLVWMGFVDQKVVWIGEWGFLPKV
jgi:hypothetical protein